ncbi:MAG TPA: hypothetical protein PL037_05065 [Elusimicrobiales bacterium]|nr:hypothetical protein [Elusimicrobiales bacterium]
MKTKLTGSLAVALTISMIGYMSISLRSANAQAGAEKTSVPAKSMPMNSPSAQPAGAGKASLAPVGSGATGLQNVEVPPEAVEVIEKAEGGCCSKSAK